MLNGGHQLGTTSTKSLWPVFRYKRQEAMILNIRRGLRSSFAKKQKRRLLYILFVLLIIGLETRREYWKHDAGLVSGRSMSLSSRIYQDFVEAGHQKPKPHFVKIIVLSPSREPAEIFGDACKKREFVAALLDRMAA